MWHFLTLSVLNFLDGVFTFWGLSFNHITEANPVMDWMWQLSPLLFLSFKIALSLALVLFSFNVKMLNFPKKLFFGIILVINIIYSLIIMLHAFWIGQVLQVISY
jgi:hypothetical protein